jgi:hypothetical protein
LNFAILCHGVIQGNGVYAKIPEVARDNLTQSHTNDQRALALDRSLGSEVYIYLHNQNMIAIVAVRPNVILDRQYLLSPQTEPSVFIFWENMTYCSKKYSFIAFQLCLKEIFAKSRKQTHR